MITLHIVWLTGSGSGIVGGGGGGNGDEFH